MSLTLLELLEKHQLYKSNSPYTYRMYLDCVERFIKETQITHIEDVDEESVFRWRLALAPVGVVGYELATMQNVTFNKNLRHMRALFNYAIKKHDLLDNPFLAICFLSEEDKPKKIVEMSDIEKTIEILKGPEYKDRAGWIWVCIVKTLYYTGMRRRQLISIRWGEICFQRREILLSSRGSKTMKEWTIPMSDAIYPCLMKLKKETIKKGQFSEKTQVFCVPMFNKSYRTQMLEPNQVTDFFRQFKRRWGIVIGAHRMRHTACSVMVNQVIGSDGNLQDAQNLLGHRNILTTYQYVESDQDSLRKRVAQMPKIGKNL